MKTSRKLPYIADKQLYAAVMGACAYVRATGYFNRAVSYYADRYNVSEDDVALYVRMAQGRGQRDANKVKPKRKYYYFAVEYSKGNERHSCNYFVPEYAEYRIVYGISERTVTDRVSARDKEGEHDMQHYFGRVLRCTTKQEAEETINCWRKEKLAL